MLKCKALASTVFALAFTLAAASMAVAGRQSQSGESGRPAPGATVSRELQNAPIDEMITGEAFTHIMRGNQLMGQGSYDEAISEFRAALEKAGKPLRTAHLNIGAAYLMKQDYKAAAESYRQAIRIAPGDALAHHKLGDALYAAGQYREADAAYRKAIDISPQGVNASAHHWLGLALSGQKRFEEAISEYRLAIEQARGQYAEARYNLGVALMERGKHQEAEREFRAAIAEEKKQWPAVHFNLAQALEKQQRYREAADEYETYLRQSPTAEDKAGLQKYIEYLRRKR